MLPEVESLRVQSLWLLKKALPSREEPDISSSILNSKARFYTNALRAYFSPKRGSALNTHTVDYGSVRKFHYACSAQVRVQCVEAGSLNITESDMSAQPI